MFKNAYVGNFWQGFRHLFASYKHPNCYFYLVEEFLSFDLLGHICKLDNN